MAAYSDIGLIGLAVMGENLALNFESRGFRVSLYNRPHPTGQQVVSRFLEGRGKGRNFKGTYTIQELVESLAPPRKIMMMIKAGQPVDEMIGQLVPHLSPGDVIIDGGNSGFEDTARRVDELESKGLLFVGTGISGGEEGALTGPSIMPGGSEKAWPAVKDLLQSIAAKLDDGTPCCAWIGKGGAGHFVKMVHNGIEYGDMQLIAESYFLLKKRENPGNDELADVFEEWNKGELNSFLIEITSRILRSRDKEGHFVLDQILDVAGQKGTGKWSAQTALDEGEPLTLITEAVFARVLSSWLEEREVAAKLYPPWEAPEPKKCDRREAVRNALYASKLVSYAQGFSLMTRASGHYGWNLDYGAIAQIWRKGCIIRSVFLEKITVAYEKEPGLKNLLFDDFFRDKIQAALPQWRRIVASGALNGISMPCMAAALSYFDGLRTLHSAANLIQAQRDYFGAHTYERVDGKRGVFFHNDWTGRGGNTVSGHYNA